MLANPVIQHPVRPMQTRGYTPVHVSFAAGLAQRGYQVEKLNEEQLIRTGQACFKVVGKHGPATGRAIHSDQVDRDFCQHALKHMPLFHPHIAAPTSLARVGQYLCFFVNESSGGGLYAMVRRGGEGGLPTCAAVYMAQQIAATADFMHRNDLYLHELSPAALQVAWSDSALPLLMVQTFQLPSEAIVPGGKAALHTAPAAIRVATGSDGVTGADVAESKAFKVACDVWAFAVALYFMIFGRFPFSREQFGAWAGQAAEEWDADAQITYTKAFGAPVDPEITTWLKAVFAAGRLPAADFAARFGSMNALFKQSWLARDLPEGVRGMNEQYQAKTEARRASPQFQALAEAFDLALEPPAVEPPAVQQREEASAGEPNGANASEPVAASAEPEAGGQVAQHAAQHAQHAHADQAAGESAPAVAGSSAGADRDLPSTEEEDVAEHCVRAESGCAQGEVKEGQEKVPAVSHAGKGAGIHGCGWPDGGCGRGQLRFAAARRAAVGVVMAMASTMALWSCCSIEVASAPSASAGALERTAHRMLQAGRLTWETRAFPTWFSPLLSVFFMAAVIGWAVQPGQSEVGTPEIA